MTGMFNGDTFACMINDIPREGVNEHGLPIRISGTDANNTYAIGRSLAENFKVSRLQRKIPIVAGALLFLEPSELRDVR